MKTTVNRQDMLDESAQQAFLAKQEKAPQEAQETQPSGAATAALAQPQLESEDSAEADPEAKLPAELRVPASPHGYHFADVQPEHRAEVEQVGRWMQSAELPASTGRHIAQAAALAASKPMSDVEYRIATNKLRDHLQHRWGGDYQSNLDAVTTELDRIDEQHNGKLWEFLNSHREVLTSAYIVQSIAHNLIRKKAKAR